MWGIAAGIVAKLILEAVIVTRVEKASPGAGEPLTQAAGRWLGGTGELFRNPVVKTVTVGEAHHVYFGGPMVCFNSMQLDAELAAIPSGASAVYLHITDLVTLIDHTAAAALIEFVDNFKRTGRGIAAIVGLDRLRARSHAETSMRVSAPVLAQERAAARESLARISLTNTEPNQPDPLVLLERISLTRVAPIPGQEDHPVRVGIARAWRFVSRAAGAMTRAVRSVFAFEGPDTFAFADRDLAWTSLERKEHEDAPSEVDKLSLSSHELPKLDPDKAAPPDPRFM